VWGFGLGVQGVPGHRQRHRIRRTPRAAPPAAQWAKTAVEFRG
jgi:hypothetical protein